MKIQLILFIAVLLFTTGCERIPDGTILTTVRIIDHNHTDITLLSAAGVNRAKEQLVIAYWHTSHGSQITTGMSPLDQFMGGQGLYTYNSSGSGGALELREPASTDIGKNDAATWEPMTRDYLDTHDEVNVVIWSWCGQVSGADEEYINTYLEKMTRLETDYPGVIFVYMTGHADGTGISGNLHRRNMQIREYCEANNKWLFDFYDIECYDPDGNYYGDRDVRDTCDYDGGNWAIEWQNAHPGEWYSCSSAHSQPLNANRKAYAAWHLFALLGEQF